MLERSQVSYRYDGSFAGFLSCIWESFAGEEEPCAFLSPEMAQCSLYPCREIDTNRARAKQVYQSLARQLPPGGRNLASLSFLSCLPERELHIYRYLRAHFEGEQLQDLSDARVFILREAVRHLTGEAELLRGFVRFSDDRGVLVGEIAPKNRVLPLLRPHFCRRLPNESFFLYDKTHKEALLYGKGRWRILPVESFTRERADEAEKQYRTLWRRFYDTIAIESRINPSLRMSHMPKRYWAELTEFQ